MPYTIQPHHHQSRKLEIVAATLLGLAALLSAFAVMRSSLIGDQVLENFTKSTKLYNQGNAKGNRDSAEVTGDQAIFLRYVDAKREGDRDLLNELRSTLITPRLAAGIKWWEKGRKEGLEVYGPFELESPYWESEDTISGRDSDKTSDDFEDEGRAAYLQANKADAKNDVFDQASAILAVTLFTAGIATLLHSRRLQLTMLGIGAFALLAGLGFVIRGQFFM